MADSEEDYSASHDEADLPEGEPALPHVPRPVTSRVSMALWTEPRVRVLVVGAVLVLLIGLGLGVQSYALWARERDLITSGTLVTATVIEANGSKLQQRQRWQSDLLLEFDAGGKKVRSLVGLAVQPKKDDLFILPGDAVSVRIDGPGITADPAFAQPNGLINPKYVTNKVEPDPLLHELFVPLIMVVIAMAVGAVAFLAVARRRAVWKTGTLQPAVLLGMGQSAIAPLARAARCYLVESRDKSSTTVYLPARSVHKEGDVIWVVAPARGRGPVLLAATYA